MKNAFVVSSVKNIPFANNYTNCLECGGAIENPSDHKCGTKILLARIEEKIDSMLEKLEAILENTRKSI